MTPRPAPSSPSLTQSEAIGREVASNEESLQSSTQQVKEVKTQLQALEIELQSQLSMVSDGVMESVGGGWVGRQKGRHWPDYGLCAESFSGGHPG